MANEFCSGLDDLSAMLDGKVPPDDVSDALKRNDFPSAAQKLKDNPNARVDVSDLSATKIRRLDDFGVPKHTVERLIKERADSAAAKLASEGGDFGRIGEKIRRGEDLTPDEYSKLWKERRDLGLDALEGPGGNKLIKAITENAIRQGDDAVKSTAKGIREHLAQCIKKNECSTASLGLSSGTIVATAAGALVAGGMGAIVTGADGKLYYYDATNNTYNRFFPSLNVSGVPGHETVITRRFEGVPGVMAPSHFEADVIKSFSPVLETLKQQNFYNKSYVEGNLPGVQGPELDKSEYMCMNFAIDGAKAINNAHGKDGIRAKVVGVYGLSVAGPDKGDIVDHALIKVEDTTKPIGQYTDSLGKTHLVYLSQLLEPQTGQMSGPGYVADYSGTPMYMGNSKYIIDYMQEFDEVSISPYESVLFGTYTGLLPSPGSSYTVAASESPRVFPEISESIHSLPEFQRSVASIEPTAPVSQAGAPVVEMQVGGGE